MYCKLCGGKMDGESATGRLGTKYFYYRCSNRDCGLRVAADEVEEAIVNRLQQVAEDQELLDRLTAETNRKLQQTKPKLERQKAGLEKDLKELQQTAGSLVIELAAMDKQTVQGFIREKLNDLSHRRNDLEYGLAEVQQELDSLDREAVDADLVRATLGQIKGVFETLKPYEQRELMQLVLKRAEVIEREITLEIYALTEAPLAGKVSDEEMVRMRPGWLPGLVPQSVAVDRFPLQLPSLMLRCRKESRTRASAGKHAIAKEWQGSMDDGIVKNRAQLAQRLGVSRARVTQALRPLVRDN
jgi:hypothetical protein